MKPIENKTPVNNLCWNLRRLIVSLWSNFRNNTIFNSVLMMCFEYRDLMENTKTKINLVCFLNSIQGWHSIEQTCQKLIWVHQASAQNKTQILKIFSYSRKQPKGLLNSFIIKSNVCFIEKHQYFIEYLIQVGLRFNLKC